MIIKKSVSADKKELKSHQDAAECHICRQKLIKKFAKGKYYQKFRGHFHDTGKYRDAAHSIS